MAKTKRASVNASISQDVKEQAEDILKDLGISRSDAIDIFYRQIIINNGIPFNLTLNDESKMTREQFDEKMSMGYEEAKRDEGLPAQQVFKEVMEDL